MIISPSPSFVKSSPQNFTLIFLLTMLYNGFILKRRERYVDFNQGTLRAAGQIDLAEHQSDGFIPLKVIAERQEISEKYLENIIKLLVKAKLLNGLRGKGGGYQLTKAPEQYTVESILRVTEDSMAPVACLEPGAEAWSPCIGMPHTLHVAGTGQADHGVLYQHHAGRSDAPRTRRV